MSELSKIPYCEVQFTKTGAVYDKKEVTALFDELANSKPTDLLVISHGWNNDMADARDLYKRYFAEVRTILDAGDVKLGDRHIAILGILWPSKRFADSDLIPGGGASLRADSDAALQRQLELLEQLVEDPKVKSQLQNARQQVPQLEANLQARRALVQAAKAVIAAENSHAGEDDGAHEISNIQDDELLKRLDAPAMTLGPPTGQGGATVVGVNINQSMAGAGAGLGDIAAGIRAAANRLLNYTTYYVMKERAGTVARTGVAPLLAEVIQRVPNLNLHLIGHSFGGRLVTATANALPTGPGGRNANLRTLLLLQAAFSHHGFSGKFASNQVGFFRGVANKVNGPIVVTHTVNDRAVGLAYAIASRIARDDASAIGDANDPYGGIGRNGAQKTDIATDGGALRNGPYDFKVGKIYNLNADKTISNHSDVCSPSTARVLLEALRSQV